MALFLVKVSWNQPYPKDADYRVEASNMATAAARALKRWRKDLNRKRPDNGITVKIVKV